MEQMQADQQKYEMDEESRQYQHVKTIRKKYVEFGLFFYKCDSCPGFQLLHQKRCSYCQIDNSYFDKKLAKIP
jgi:hypothetical protein